MVEEDAFCVVCVAVLTASLVIFRLTTPARPPCRKPEDPDAVAPARLEALSAKFPTTFPAMPAARETPLNATIASPSMEPPVCPTVDTDTCHEAVDFLRDFEKTNRAEKPDQDISRHGLAAGTADCGFDIAFLQSKRRYRQGERKQKNGAQQRNDSMIFLRGNDLLHGKRI